MVKNRYTTRPPTTILLILLNAEKEHLCMKRMGVYIERVEPSKREDKR